MRKKDLSCFTFFLKKIKRSGKSEKEKQKKKKGELFKIEIEKGRKKKLSYARRASNKRARKTKKKGMK